MDVPGRGGKFLHRSSVFFKEALNKAGNNIGSTCSCDNGHYCCGAGMEAFRDGRPASALETFKEAIADATLRLSSVGDRWTRLS